MSVPCFGLKPNWLSVVATLVRCRTKCSAQTTWRWKLQGKQAYSSQNHFMSSFLFLQIGTMTVYMRSWGIFPCIKHKKYQSTPKHNNSFALHHWTKWRTSPALHHWTKWRTSPQVLTTESMAVKSELTFLVQLHVSKIFGSGWRMIIRSIQNWKLLCYFYNWLGLQIKAVEPEPKLQAPASTI